MEVANKKIHGFLTHVRTEFTTQAKHVAKLSSQKNLNGGNLKQLGVVAHVIFKVLKSLVIS